MNRRDLIIAGIAGLSTAVIARGQEAATNPEVESIRALLKAHDEAMTNHDLEGVLATLTEKAAIMGTGPGEIWSGKEEIKDAYEHFFQNFDKGQQDFEYHFRIGGVDADLGWLMASGNVTGKKDGKDFSYPLNISMTVTKQGGKWLISSMHFSTFATPETKAVK